MLLGALAPGASANPVVPGDHPDPSLIRERDGWYVASTSGDWLPAFPVLRSRDLRGWHQVGSVLAPRPRWAASDFWAPELLRRGGRVLAYYAALARDGRRCVAVASAGRVRGPYRDHGPLVCSRTGEIDPLPVTDEHGADWLLWKRDGNSRGRPTPILAAPLAPGGLSLAGPPRELFRADAAWERGLVEAPALLRRHGLFYLVYSAGRCCGLDLHVHHGRGALRLADGALGEAAGAAPHAAARCSAARDTRASRPLRAACRCSPTTPTVRGDAANRQLLLVEAERAGRWLAEAAPGRGSPRSRSRTAARLSSGSRLDREWQWPAGARPTRAPSQAVACCLVAGSSGGRPDTARVPRGRDGRPAPRRRSRGPGRRLRPAAEAIGVELRGGARSPGGSTPAARPQLANDASSTGRADPAADRPRSARHG